MSRMKTAACGLTAGMALALGGCEFSAGVGDQATQQRQVRELAQEASTVASACVTSYLRQRDMTAAVQRGEGERSTIGPAVAQAETACREASRHFQSARPPAILNAENKELLRTALASCQTAYGDVAGQLALKAAVYAGPEGWTSDENEAALQRWFGSMPVCDRAWTTAMTPLALQTVQIPVLMGGGAPAATEQSAPAAATAAEGDPVLTPSAPAPGQEGQYGKLPPGGEATPPAAAAPPEQPVVDDPGGEEKP